MMPEEDERTDEMPAARKRELIARGASMQPVVMVGKGGLSEGVVADADGQLKVRRLIKVKVGPKMDKDGFMALAGELATRTGSTLIQAKGRTFLLYRDRS